jgi:hypothetical protein
MSYRVLVCVELPDGSQQYLPVVRYPGATDRQLTLGENETNTSFASQKDARDWSIACLPGKVQIKEGK